MPLKIVRQTLKVRSVKFTARKAGTCRFLIKHQHLWHTFEFQRPNFPALVWTLFTKTMNLRPNREYSALLLRPRLIRRDFFDIVHSLVKFFGRLLSLFMRND